jgi:hypothetical protein
VRGEERLARSDWRDAETVTASSLRTGPVARYVRDMRRREGGREWMRRIIKMIQSSLRRRHPPVA